MKKTVVKSLRKYLIGAKFLGVGTTAICFLMVDGRVLKIYRDSDNKRFLFRYFEDMGSHLEMLGNLKIDTYNVPEELILKDGEVIAYITDYIKGEKFDYVSLGNQIDKILNAYPKLVDDTYEASEQKLALFDYYARNIILNDYFNLIDLDACKFLDKDTRVLFKSNMCKLNRSIITNIFGVDARKYDMTFYDNNLNELYQCVAFRQYDKFDEFFKLVCEYVKMENPKIRDLRRCKLVKQSLNPKMISAK